MASSSKAIELNSSEGQSLLRSVVDENGGLYQPILYVIFSKQATLAGCGVQSSAVLLSANSLGQRYEASSFLSVKPSSFDRRLIPYTELGMYSLPQTLAVTNSETVARHGLTLSDVALILKSHGCSVKEVHASHSSPEKFRADVVDALSHFDSQSGIIVNFSRGKITPNSRRAHHSPLVAYHTASDRVLVLDTALNMPHFWVSITDLFRAMDTKDYMVEQSRGYVVVSK